MSNVETVAEPRCTVCGTAVAEDVPRCPNCGLSHPARVLAPGGLWGVALGADARVAGLARDRGRRPLKFRLRSGIGRAPAGHPACPSARMHGTEVLGGASPKSCLCC